MDDEIVDAGPQHSSMLGESTKSNDSLTDEVNNYSIISALTN